MKKLIVFFIFCLLEVSSKAYINIYPLKFDKRIDKGGEVQEFVLTNITDKEQRYRVYVENDNKGNDMSKWSEIYPENITLKPGDQKKVLFFVKSPPNTKNGEYTAILGIKELEVPKSKKDKTLKVLSNLKMTLYGYIGELSDKIQLKNIDIKINTGIITNLSGEVRNIGEKISEIEIYFGSKKQKDQYIGEARIKVNEQIDLQDIEVDLSKFKVDKNMYIEIYEKNEGKLLVKKKIN
ncbi:MAG: hypothetical protein RR523_04780 [Cetobacterium sp.]|uniref:COG1470 family protein n=1 Tax=Cetobacterium sp. TaxID=2071632 RepID=UPI002FC8E92B